MRRIARIFFLAAGLLTTGSVTAANPLSAAQASAQPDAGITPAQTALIIMHGKWGKPPAPLAERFAKEGFHVVSPEMPWGRDRLYDMPYEEALKSVHATVKELRAKGFRKIIIGGQSFGANGALAYTSVYGDVDGLFMMAPGHNPEIGKQWQAPGLIADAKELVSKGKGDTLVDLIDYNDGNRSKAIRIPAKVYISFYYENSLANMSLSASKVKKSLPVLMIMGNGDYITGQGRGYIFGRLPEHPLSRYVESDASHREVPKASFPMIRDWIAAVTSSGGIAK